MPLFVPPQPSRLVAGERLSPERGVINEAQTRPLIELYGQGVLPESVLVVSPYDATRPVGADGTFQARRITRVDAIGQVTEALAPLVALESQHYTVGQPLASSTFDAPINEVTAFAASAGREAGSVVNPVSAGADQQGGGLEFVGSPDAVALKDTSSGGQIRIYEPSPEQQAAIRARNQANFQRYLDSQATIGAGVSRNEPIPPSLPSIPVANDPVLFYSGSHIPLPPQLGGNVVDPIYGELQGSLGF